MSNKTFLLERQIEVLEAIQEDFNDKMAALETAIEEHKTAQEDALAGLLNSLDRLNDTVETFCEEVTA